MQPQAKKLVRHLLAALFLSIAVIGGFIPFLQGWMFVIPALLILAIDYRLIRDVVVRPMRRKMPAMFQKASRFRRNLRGANKKANSSKKETTP